MIWASNRTPPDNYDVSVLRHGIGLSIALAERMTSTCPECNRVGGINSRYLRRSDRKIVLQFRCFRCKRTWTPASNNLEKHQKKRFINEPLGLLLSSAVSMQRTARILKVNPKTVARRVPYLARKARLVLEKYEEKQRAEKQLFMDELITFEHTRCKPLAVCMIVNQERRILSFSVSSMPAIGKHLKEISLKKYGKRPNHRRKGIEECLKKIETRIHPDAKISTDEEPSYARLIRRNLPLASHEQPPSKRAVIAGQGELKDRTYDPIFAINHTFAMLRANLARLIRRTWCTTKKAERLFDFITIYAGFHNEKLITQTS